MEEEGGIDVLVCAAGKSVKGRCPEELTPEVREGLLAVNLSGAFYAARAALPYLRAFEGLVILVSSVSCSWAEASGPACGALKSGMSRFAHAAGFEEHASGVRFTSLNPGIVDKAPSWTTAPSLRAPGYAPRA